MSIQNRDGDPAAGVGQGQPTGPGEGPMGPMWIVAVALYLVIASGLVLYGLIKLWPYPTPSGEPKVEAEAMPSPTPVVQVAAATPPPTAAPVGRTATPLPGAAAGTTAATTTAASQNPAQTPSPHPTPAPTPGNRELPDPEVISFFGGLIKPSIYLETRLLLLVMLAGALGGLMHSLRSLYWYTGNRMMVWSWVAFYLLLPFTGAMLSVIFYFVVRGGFFSPEAKFGNTSPFGFAALSALVGLFSPQAVLKLKEVAETIFTKPPAGADTKEQANAAKNTTAIQSGDVIDELDGHDAEVTADTLDQNLPITKGGVG